jgi:putative membrane protein
VVRQAFFMSWSILPALNAFLNSTSAILLAFGFWKIRGKHVAAHRLAMLAAFTTSTCFLVSYIAHHVHVGNVRYQGHGWMRTLYFAILITHTILAVVIVPLVLRTLFFGLKGRLVDHRAIARWTLPLWIYVSVTGVVIYEMLY